VALDESKHARDGPTLVEDLREGSVRAGLIAACEERAPAIAVVGSRVRTALRPAPDWHGMRPRQRWLLPVLVVCARP
jgi:hypothetical protein